MKDTVLIELANRWKADVQADAQTPADEENELGNAKAKGMRETKRECADTLIALVQMLGEKE